MAFINKWFKKKEEEQLEAVAKQPAELKAEKKPVTKSKKETTNESDSKTIEKPKEKKQKKDLHRNVLGDAHKILVRPFVSEKSATIESKGIYTFVVATDATKVDVKQAVSQVYGVAPAKVRMIHMQGKFTRFGRRQGRRVDWKKAIITLPKGQTIDIHTGV